MIDFAFLAPGKPLNANQRLHWRERNNRTQVWRQAAYVHALKAKIGQHVGMPWSRAHVTITISFSDARRRDVNNWQPTAKAIVDGIVDAGILPDDNDTHLVGPDLRRGEQCTGRIPHIAVRIQPLEGA